MYITFYVVDVFILGSALAPATVSVVLLSYQQLYITNNVGASGLEKEESTRPIHRVTPSVA